MDDEVLDDQDPKSINLNQHLINYAKTAFYQAIKYNDPNYYIPTFVDNLIRGISGDETSDNYIYVIPQSMTSPNQSIDGMNPGSIAHLIFNTDNNYSYCENLPFSTSSLLPSPLDGYNRGYYASNGLTFVAFIYDMLYYEMTDAQRAAAGENIEVLSGYLYNYLCNTRHGLIGMPVEDEWHNDYAPLWAVSDGNFVLDWTEGHGRINLLGTRSMETICALGYSRLVLGYRPGSDEILDWVLYMLTTVPIQEDFNGLLSYIVKKEWSIRRGI